MNKKKRTIKKPVTPKGQNILDRGFIVTINGRMVTPGEVFGTDEVTADRLSELKEKGLVRGVMSTEEKRTITK